MSARPNAAGVLRVVKAQGHFPDLTVLGTEKLYRAAEAVGVGHKQGALGAVNFQTGLLRIVHVKGGEGWVPVAPLSKFMMPVT